MQRDKLVQDLTLANSELNERCRRRSDECDRLRDDLKAQAAEMVTLQARLKDSQFNLTEFQTSTLPIQYELTKTVHEKNLLADQVKYLEAELQKKSQEERAFRAECAAKSDQLTHALSDAQAQLEAASRQIAMLKVRHLT
jgi:chromosome segregation ATPase